MKCSNKMNNTEDKASLWVICGCMKDDIQLFMQVQDFVIMWRRQNSKIVHMCDPKITNHPKKKQNKKKQKTDFKY